MGDNSSSEFGKLEEYTELVNHLVRGKYAHLCHSHFRGNDIFLK